MERAVLDDEERLSGLIHTELRLIARPRTADDEVT
jgi:hypothetical protein